MRHFHFSYIYLFLSFSFSFVLIGVRRSLRVKFPIALRVELVRAEIAPNARPIASVGTFHARVSRESVHDIVDVTRRKHEITRPLARRRRVCAVVLSVLRQNPLVGGEPWRATSARGYVGVSAP